MVAKINYGSSLYGAVSYNHNKVENKQASVITYNKMYTNIRDGKDISFSNALRSFEDYLVTNSRIEKPIAHFSLNPDPKDNLSEEDLVSIAHEYMEKMGYQHQPYIVYKHNDIDREHIHIVTVRVDEYGKKISDRFDYKRSMDTCREIENKYSLNKVDLTEKVSPEYILKSVDFRKGDIKKQISNTLKALIRDYRFQSLGEYNALLSCFNIHSKYVKGEEAGNPYHGIVYSATDDTGELKVNPIKSSRIGKDVGYKFLTKIMETTAGNLKKEKVPYKSKAVIASAIKSANSKDDFVRKLRDNRISVVFRSNEEGRIYGVTFIDHNDKIVFNGSRLGKEFSANVLNDLFKSLPEKQPENNTVVIDEQGKSSINDFSPDLWNKTALSEEEYHSSESSLSDIFGNFHINARGDDPEEVAFAKRMRRKKKGRRR